MKTIFPKGVLLGLIIAASIFACSSGDNGEDPPPPPPVYRYYAYVANSESNDVSAYAINAATGALTAVAGSPFAAGDSVRGIAIVRIIQ
jgi:hypothetical protein